MKVVGLISGGKDSCYNLMQCVAAGHEIVALANLFPKGVDELDSFMYQSVGHTGIDVYAEAMGIPLFRREIQGTSLSTDSIDYQPMEGDEVEDLFLLLKGVKESCEIEAVSVGAVLSDYQRLRVENVCQRLELVCLAYLWRRDQSELLQEMVTSGIDALVIKVASFGLSPSKHLGISISDLLPYFEEMKEKYCLNVCGEGGEYETFTLDCPLFKKRIIVDKSELIQSSDDVGYLNLISLKLEDKNIDSSECLRNNIRKPFDFLSDLQLNEEEQQAENEAKEVPLDITEDDLRDTNYANDDCDEDNISTTQLQTTSSGFSWWSLRGMSACQILTKLKICLEENGLSLDDLVSVRFLVKDMNEYIFHNKEYAEFFLQNPPARAYVQVPLDIKETISMDAIAWKECHINTNDSPTHSARRTTMHVQSISHWAPANIGPYSQAVKIGNIFFIAGIIGLVPGTMELLKGNAELQTRLTLRHINRIISAIAHKSDIRAVVQGVCYVTNLGDIPVVRRMMARMSESQISTYVVVPSLPRAALVEWHTWGHVDNAKFNYEEKGYTSGNINVTLRQRFSDDHCFCAAITTVSYKERADITVSALEEVITYTLNQLLSEKLPEEPVQLSAFYKINLVERCSLWSALQTCPSNVFKCLIPVIALEDKSTAVSFVMARY